MSLPFLSDFPTNRVKAKDFLLFLNLKNFDHFSWLCLTSCELHDPAQHCKSSPWKNTILFYPALIYASKYGTWQNLWLSVISLLEPSSWWKLEMLHFCTEDWYFLQTFKNKLSWIYEKILFSFYQSHRVRRETKKLKGALENPAGGENSIFNEIVKYGSN